MQRLKGITLERSKDVLKCPLMTHTVHLRRDPNLQINPVEDGCVVYQPQSDRVHFLNQTAALVLELCDGQCTPGDIETWVAEAYGIEATPLQNLTAELLEKFVTEGLVSRGAPVSDTAHY